MTCLSPRASSVKARPTDCAARPPTPASTSSKIIVGATVEEEQRFNAECETRQLASRSCLRDRFEVISRVQSSPETHLLESPFVKLGFSKFHVEACVRQGEVGEAFCYVAAQPFRGLCPRLGEQCCPGSSFGLQQRGLVLPTV